MREDEGDFERYKARYDSVVKSSEEREVGSQVESLYGEYRDLGQELMDDKEEQDQLFERINENFGRIDRIADDGIHASIDQVAADGPDKISASSEAETNLARTLGLEVIAEGIERASQLASLTELGCDQSQGYYVGRPVEAAAADEILETVYSP